MEGWEGKVEGDESREMMVMLKLLVARRAERIWVPIVPLALVGGLILLCERDYFGGCWWLTPTRATFLMWLLSAIVVVVICC